MQVSDLLGQYNNMAGSIGKNDMSKMVSSLKDMATGNIFEGTVNVNKDGQVVLGLSNGQQITARLDNNVSITEGQSMFFQVKSNDGNTIEIKPFLLEGNSVNLTLMNALNAANLKPSSQNLSMINQMMNEQMSIDKNSLNSMSRLIAQNPSVNMNTLISMQKLGLPIDASMATQFENYMDDKQAITSAIDDFIMELPKTLSDSSLGKNEMLDIAKNVIGIINDTVAGSEDSGNSSVGNLDTNNQVVNNSAVSNSNMENTLTSDSNMINPGATNSNINNTATGNQDNNVNNTVSGNQDNNVNNTASGNPDINVSNTASGNQDNNVNNTASANQDVNVNNTASGNQDNNVNNTASGNQDNNVNDTASANPDNNVNNTVSGKQNMDNFSAGTDSMTLNNLEPAKLESYLKANPDSSRELLLQISSLLDNADNVDEKMVRDLFKSNIFSKMIGDVLKEQWTIKPEQLTKENAIRNLYEELESKLNKITEAVKAAGMENENISALASDIKSNISFMNQINEAYTFAQIPLSMSNQTASGQLFVYTNKQALKAKTKDFSAFLHLDMDNLGQTDVSIKMHERNVSTNFYFDNDEAFELVSKNKDKLEERLKDLGYNCTVSVSNDSKKVNFVDDFLKKGEKTAGLVHRYSFDMKA